MGVGKANWSCEKALAVLHCGDNPGGKEINFQLPRFPACPGMTQPPTAACSVVSGTGELL